MYLNETILDTFSCYRLYFVNNNFLCVIFEGVANKTERQLLSTGRLQKQEHSCTEIIHSSTTAQNAKNICMTHFPCCNIAYSFKTCSKITISVIKFHLILFCMICHNTCPDCYGVCNFMLNHILFTMVQLISGCHKSSLL